MEAVVLRPRAVVPAGGVLVARGAAEALLRPGRPLPQEEDQGHAGAAAAAAAAKHQLRRSSLRGESTNIRARIL